MNSYGLKTSPTEEMGAEYFELVAAACIAIVVIVLAVLDKEAYLHSGKLLTTYCRRHSMSSTFDHI